MIARLNNPITAAIALGLFLWLATYAYGEKEHGYTKKERDALGALIDGTQDKQVAGMVFLYGDSYE